MKRKIFSSFVHKIDLRIFIFISFIRHTPNPATEGSVGGNVKKERTNEMEEKKE